MSRLERLRSLVNQRINAAADDIGRLLEGKIQEYEEEVRFFREENNSLQQKLLQFAAKPDVQLVVLGEDEAGSSDDQEESPSEDSDPAPAPSPVRGPKQTRKSPKADGKDNDSPGTSSATDEDHDGQQRRKNSKRRAPQTHGVKAKRSKN